MKHILTSITLTLILAAALPAIAAEPLVAPIRISGGGTYDYVVVGESPMATDGFDNLYDSFAPAGNLNDVYITAWFDHPEWLQVKNRFRGDIRSLATRQDWVLSVVSTLPAGTPLTVALDNRMNILPAGLQMTVSNISNTSSTSILNGGMFTFSAPLPGTVTQLVITAQQPAGNNTQVSTGTYAADGDLDDDGVTSIADVLAIFRMAYGIDPVSETARAHGDMDGDGRIRLTDVLAVLRKLLGL